MIDSRADGVSESNGTHHIVVIGIKRVEKACCTPATAANNESLLRGVMRELGPWRLVLLGEVVERHATGDSDQCDASCCLKKPPPKGAFRRGRWWWELEVRRKKASRVNVRTSGYG